MIYKVCEKHKEELQGLFERYQSSDDVVKRGLLCLGEIACNALLFIGINPSYSEKRAVNNPPSIIFQKLEEIKAYKYFKKFEEISKEVKIEWTHLDLFYFQHTNQKFVTHLQRSSDQTRAFLNDQLVVTKKILNSVKPRIIVINNAQAGDIYMNNEILNYKNKLEFDEQYGTYILNDKDSKIPVFFTSMLTGQRALDLGSYKRLIWHINFVKHLLAQ
jgi:hypothetical protein